uniref:Putative ovule protein n=1 Tax=Solanum chacoense TaxID=4108 RepID=A0A0V0HG88_SOLCH
MSPSVAKGLLNLRELEIVNCQSMEEVITKGEGIMTLFPLLEELKLQTLPKLGHFFLTEHALQIPFLREVMIYDQGRTHVVLKGFTRTHSAKNYTVYIK